jgi:hypothetical protein
MDRKRQETRWNVPRKDRQTIRTRREKRNRVIGRLVLAGALGILALGSVRALLPRSSLNIHGTPWQHWASPESAGVSEAALDNVLSHVRTLGTTGLMVVKGGKVLLEYGDLDAKGFMAEGRCSVLAMLYGKAVSEGTIDLSLTLEQLGVDDRPGLLPTEKKATIEDLLTSRSAVYHPTEFLDPKEDLPARGSVQPGTHFYFHSWACLAARVIYEMLTEREFSQAVAEDLAVPLGLQDYTGRSYNPGHDRSRSRFTLFHLYVSTRDVARFGQLMLQNGEWDGRQLVPPDWVSRITTMVTPPAEVNPPPYQGMGLGFGYQWWVWPDSDPKSPYAGAYTYRADWGQYLTVLPNLDMVVAHQRFAGWYGRPERGVSFREYLGLLDRIVVAAADSGATSAGRS